MESFRCKYCNKFLVRYYKQKTDFCCDEHFIKYQIENNDEN